VWIELRERLSEGVLASLSAQKAKNCPPNGGGRRFKSIQEPQEGSTKIAGSQGPATRSRDQKKV